MDPVRTIQEVYQREGRVPSVRQLVKAGVRKAEIYENYGGLRGLCEAAGVPLPEQRYERVGAAMKSPRGLPQPGEPVESIYKPLPQPYVQPPPPQRPAAAQPVVRFEVSQLSKSDVEHMIEAKVAPPKPPEEAPTIENQIREVFGVDAQARKTHDNLIEQLRTNQKELGKHADSVREKLSKAPPSAQAQPKLTLNQAELIVKEMVSDAFATIEKAKQDKLELEAREIDEKREKEKAPAAGSNPSGPATQVEEESETEKSGEESSLEVHEELPRRIFPILRRPILRQRRRLLR